MGWLQTLVGNTGEGVAKPIDAMGNALDQIFTSDEEKLSHAEVMAKLEQQPLIAQQLLNELGAKSDNIFISGWRPFIGWVAGVTLAIYYIPQFVVATYLWAKFSLLAGGIQPYPMDSRQLMELVWALLGLGAYRSIDKAIERKGK
jgi:hypothetical protein